MISHNPHFTEIEHLDSIILKTVCPYCDKKQTLVFDGDKANAYRQGKVAYEAGYLLQHAFSSFTPDEREFIQTGICNSCWDEL